MVEDNVKSNDYAYCDPNHTESNAEALAKYFGDHSQEDFCVAPKQVVDAHHEQRTCHSDAEAHD